MDDIIELRKANDDLKKYAYLISRKNTWGLLNRREKQMLIYRKQIHDLGADNKRLQLKIAELEK